MQRKNVTLRIFKKKLGYQSKRNDFSSTMKVNFIGLFCSKHLYGTKHEKYFY